MRSGEKTTRSRHRLRPRNRQSYRGPEVRATALDLVAPDSARQIVAEAREAWGGLDILVTNAASAAQGGFLELDDEAWPTDSA